MSLQVAAAVVDAGLNVVATYEAKINATTEQLESMVPFVRNMHTSSGLIEEIPHGVSVAEAEYQVIEYLLRFVPEDQRAPLAAARHSPTPDASSVPHVRSTKPSRRGAGCH